MPGTIKEPENKNEYIPQIPEIEKTVKDFAGRDFTVTMYNKDLILPDYDSSPISNKIIERNAEIEQEYNIKIKAYEGLDSSNFVSVVSENYNAGLFCGDLLVIPNYMLPIFVSQKNLMSIGALPFVDLNAPCYNKKATDSATIGNFVHALYGDLTYSPDKSACVFFNKDFISSHNLLTPYEMDKRNQWTWDSFDVLAKAVIQDVNNNHIADFQDIYGLCSSYTRPEMVDIMWASCGEQFFENNVPYAPKMIFNTEKTQKIIDKIRRLLYNESDKIYINSVQGLSGYEMFLQGRGLFCIGTLSTAKKLAKAGLNYGIMPLPKFDAKAPYRSYIDQTADVICVMNNIPDSEFTGTILQAIAEKSTFNNSDYYKKYYINNFLTDNTSALMLDKIFDTPYYDLATSLGSSYLEIASASDEIIYSNLSTGIAFDTLYNQNLKPFDAFVKNKFTTKGE